ncbi:hypothetical protein GQX74_014964 [Glossina fuscipes]|nr:hypothetical protein GQX74_014964 [Glossina fuscipes]
MKLHQLNKKTKEKFQNTRLKESNNKPLFGYLTVIAKLVRSKTAYVLVARLYSQFDQIQPDQIQLLVKHSRLYTHDMPFKCSFCKKVFRRVDTLKCHLIQHSKGNLHTCPECAEASSSKHHRLVCTLRVRRQKKGKICFPKITSLNHYIS